MENFHVVCIIPSLYAGAGSVNVMMNHIRFSNKNKINYSIIVYRDTPSIYYEELNNLGIEVHLIPKPSLKNFYKIKKRLKEIYSCSLNSISLVHYYDPLMILPTFRAFIKLKCNKFIAHALSSILSENKNNLVRNALLSYPIRYIASDLWACSLPAAITWFGRNAINKNNVKIIQEAIHVDKYAYSEKTRVELREVYQLKNEIVIGHIGRFNSNKNQMFLIEMLKQLITNRDDIILCLVGDGEMLEEVKSKVKEYHLSSKVIFTGLRNDAHKFYSFFDFFCLPSHSEGFGLVALEAQTSGLWTLVSSSIPSDVLVTDLAFGFSIYDVNAWVNFILENIVKNVKKRETYKEIIKELGLDLTSLGQRITQYYQEIIEGDK